MKKIFLTIVSSAVVALSFAQSVAEGIKDIYYQKYKSAKDVLQKAVTANPADPDANYWLGQVYVNQDDLAGARSVYAKAMTATNQNPLVVVGMGHVELLEGKNADAKAHFEAAIGTTGKKGDVKVLTAIGRANADGDTKNGDPAYGIEKLNAAAKLDPKNPEIPVLIGISELKRGAEYGGAATTAYRQALVADPNYAYAKLREARIFESQGNKDIFIPLLEQATTLDPNYGPAWLELYTYYSRRDVNKAKTYLDKYITLADPDCETSFFYADYLLQAGQRDNALAKAKEMEAACSAETFPKLNKLYAIIYSRQGDSLQAKSYMEKYMQREVPAKLGSDDYIMYVNILAKFPGNNDLVEQNINKALSLDTVVAHQLVIINDVAQSNAKDSNYAGELKWRTVYAGLKPNLTATELYYWGLSGINAKNYSQADTIFSRYVTEHPDQVTGYSLRARAAKLNDADTSKGTAIPAISAYSTFLKQDTAKNKNVIITNYGYSVFYYVNRAKDYPKALEAVDSILAIDPANNYALGARSQLLKLINSPGKPASTTPANKPATPATKPATPATKPRTTGR